MNFWLGVLAGIIATVIVTIIGYLARYLIVVRIGQYFIEKVIIRYHGFQYQAKSWDHPRRVVAK